MIKDGINANNKGSNLEENKFSILKKALLIVSVLCCILLLHWLLRTKGLTLRRRINFVFNKLGY